MAGTEVLNRRAGEHALTQAAGTRRYDLTDQVIAAVDGLLRALGDAPSAHDKASHGKDSHGKDSMETQERRQPWPCDSCPEDDLNEEETQHSAGLMRVNHAGEVAAQALYLSQAALARSEAVRSLLHQSAAEEEAHLSWCRRRLRELGADSSRLQPLWFFGSWLIGTAASCAGDRWSLGFLLETERQVVAHLEEHERRLPDNDLRSRAIVRKMRQDEAEHAHSALRAGASELPRPLKRCMSWVSKIMTVTAYRI